MPEKIQLRKIHEGYQQKVEDFLVPGEIHGAAGELLEKLEVGDVITAVEWNQHVYDPDLKVEGEHFVKALMIDRHSLVMHPTWVSLKPGVSLERRPREQSERRP